MVESSEDLVESARREEREGCFAQAECLWRSALALTSPQSDSEAALVARELGLFLRRFLPTSRQPAHYLRISAEMERNPRSADLTLLELAACLIATGDFEEAEEVLASIREPTPRVALCRGKLLLERGAVLDAEATFRAALECPPRAEALTLLGEALLKKKEFEEGARVLSEAVHEWGMERGFLGALALYLKSCEEMSAVEEANSFCASLVSQMEGAHPYDKCEVLMCWADTYPWNQEAGLQYFQALRLYRSMRAVSAYVAVVLSRLIKFFCAREVWKVELRAEACKQLLEVWAQLPEASLLMRVDRLSFSEELFAKKLLRVASSDDALVQGDILLALSTEFHSSPTQVQIDRAVEVFAERNPSTKSLADIYACLDDREEEALQMFRLLRMSPLRICSLRNWTAAKIADEHEGSIEWVKHEAYWREVLSLYEETLSFCREKAPISWMTISQLRELGNFYKSSRCAAEALQCFQEALRVATLINPDSLCIAECLLDVASLQRDAEELVNRAAEIVARLKKPSVAAGKVCLRLSTLRTRREDAFSSFFAGFAAASPSVRLNRVSLLSGASEQLSRMSRQELKRMLALFSGISLRFPRTERLLKALQHDSDLGDALPEADRLPDVLLSKLCEIYQRQSRLSDTERTTCLIFSKSRRHVNSLRNCYGEGLNIHRLFRK